MKAPFYPIIYIRRYAMTEGERDDTAADPFCGFNLGSTVYRASIDKKAPPKRFFFESPVLRLASDFGYCDVYEQGADIMDAEWKPGGGRSGIDAKSIVVYRYYDEGSTLFGDGKVSPIEKYARDLSTLILKVRDLVCAEEAGALKPDDFRCYLVAHSMGGLIVRGFLQNPLLGSAEARKAIDKIFTYATPHNGIEVAGANVPSWLKLNEIDTFSRERMAAYLNLKVAFAKYGRVDYVPSSAFPLERIFCMVGTNRSDYEAAKGLSRTFVGDGSDGLVKIANASLWGLDDKNNVTGAAATAFAYRSHSGVFGIVNSEEAYQNLIRFLFGDVRVDMWIEIDEVRLPAEIENDDVDALYQFELLARARGKRWYLSRRVSEEDSPACRTHKELTGKQAGAARNVYVSTVHLANSAKVSTSDRTLAYAMDVRVRVPDYEKNRAFWPNQHYEGSYLFRDSLIVSLTPALTTDGDWKVEYGWESQSVGLANHSVAYSALQGGKLRIEVNLPAPNTKPGISGRVLLIASAWN